MSDDKKYTPREVGLEVHQDNANDKTSNECHTSNECSKASEASRLLANNEEGGYHTIDDTKCSCMIL